MHKSKTRYLFSRSCISNASRSFLLSAIAAGLLTGCATSASSSSVLRGKIIPGDIGIELRVSDADARFDDPGIGAATIRLSSLQESAVPIVEALTNDDGTFTIPLTPAQANLDMELLVKADGFVPLRGIATLPMPEGKQLLILLEPLRDRQEQSR